jgi:hypothetical protein
LTRQYGGEATQNIVATEQLDVSVIIASWNTRDILRDCLQSVYQQGGNVCLKVIVVDNASKDGSAEMVAVEFPQVQIIRNPDNRGFAAANNQGIAVAEGRYILLLNPDTVVLDQAIAKAVAFADARPEVGIVGCRTIFPDGRLQYNCYTFPSLLNLALKLSRLSRTFRRNRFFGRYRLTWWDYNSVRQIDAVAGCFMLARRQAIDEVGLMAEQYFMYSEDTDWCWRFRRKGWRTMYTPDPCIIHLRDASGSQAPAEMNLWYRRSLLMFLEMKSGWVTRWIANLMFCIASIIRLPALAIRRLLGGNGAQAARQQWRLSVAALRFHLLGHFPCSP